MPFHSRRRRATKTVYAPPAKLALTLRLMQKAMEDREDARIGALEVLRPRYIEMLQKWSPPPLASDANGTLRITYGMVRGYVLWLLGAVYGGEHLI